jgi:hypothetical protein
VTEASEHPLSALVVLRPAPGRELGDAGPITSANVAESLPEPGAVATAQAVFSRLGFDVSAAGGPSFSITGPRSLFEEVFEPLEIEGEAVRTSVRAARGGLELRLDRLPPDARELVQTVTFTPPPDFGPTEYASSA